MMRDIVTPAERLAPVDDKLQAAMRWLRQHSTRGYCMDRPLSRLPAKQCQPTVLDRWLDQRRSRA